MKTLRIESLRRLRAKGRSRVGEMAESLVQPGFARRVAADAGREVVRVKGHRRSARRVETGVHGAGREAGSGWSARFARNLRMRAPTSPSRMPSFQHEGLVQLFRNCPELIARLLRDVLKIPVPDHAEIRVEDSDLSQVLPAKFTADIVLRFHDGRPVFVAVGEMQLDIDERKRATWPAYVTTNVSRYKCPVCLLVITPSARVAAWARQPIVLGPGSVVTPVVLGPEQIPAVLDALEAAQMPELAVLSAMVHGNDPELGEGVVRAALSATVGLEPEREVLYSDLVLASLNGAMRAAMEKLMATGQYELQTEYAKRRAAEIARDRAEREQVAREREQWAAEKARAERERARVREEALAEGKAEGEAKGKAEGEARGRIADIFRVLRVRGLELNAEQERRIRGCSDLDTLDRWHERAVTAATTANVFAD